MPPHKPGVPIEELVRMLRSGMTPTEIARAIGTSRPNVTYRLIRAGEMEGSMAAHERFTKNRAERDASVRAAWLARAKAASGVKE